MAKTQEGSFYICNAFPMDFDSIRCIMKFGKTKFFGRTKRKQYHAKDFFANYTTHRVLVRQSAGSDEVLGYAEFQNYPEIEALPKSCWLDWLHFHYCVQKPLSATNVLFCNYFLYHQNYQPEIMLAVLTEIFYRENQVRYIITVEMPEQKYIYKEDIPTYELPNLYGETYYPREFSVMQCKNVQRIHIFLRDNLVPKMRYRLALPEDNDDIVEIIDNDRPDLREELGDYYIAEELLKDNITHSICIVTEVDHLTSGFIWLNDNVDILKIMQNFECDIFSHILKFTLAENFREKIIRVSTMERKHPSNIFTDEALMEIFEEGCFAKYIVIKQASECSMSSKQSTNVQSMSGNITTINERMFVRQEPFRKFQNISETLKSDDYYTNTQFKGIRFYYNIPEMSENINWKEAEPRFINKQSNFFALQLFGLHYIHDTRRIYRFLATAFNAFPDRDYCIFSIPPMVPPTKCLKEALKYFIQIQPRPGCCLSDNVYITHRSSIYGETSIHNIRYEDIPYIEGMVQSNKRRSTGIRTTDASIFKETFQPPTLKDSDILHEVLIDALENPYTEYRFMTIRCGNSSKPIDENPIIGFIILRKLTKAYLLRKHFMVPASSFDGTAEVIMLRLHPLYHFKSVVLFRELARFSEFWEFYYFAPIKALPNDLASAMQPVEPRRIKYPNSEVDHEDLATPSEDSIIQRKYGVDLDKDIFSIFHESLKPRKYLGNSNTLVIIGFNNVCKAFLRLMVFGWNTTDLKSSDMFCCIPRLNITVIASPGVIEAEYDTDFKCAICNNQYDCWLHKNNWNEYIKDTIYRMDFRKWVKFVHGYVKKIYKRKKIIMLTNNCEVHYDELLLLNDTQYGMPMQFSSKTEIPSNYAHVNNRMDKIILYHKLKILTHEFNTPEILVYGLNIQTFEFINFLIKHGVEAKSITLVTPYQLNDQRVYLQLNNPYVDTRTESIFLEMIEDLGVTVHESCNFSHWVRYRSNDNLTSVVFERFSNSELVDVNCDFFICYKERSIGANFVTVLKESGISLKNKYEILVNDKYQTNDPHIYAFGDYIKHIEEPNHQYKWVSSEEAADKLMQILNLKIYPKDGEKAECKFRKPAYFEADLPMGHYMAKCTMPKRYLANHLTNDYDHSMTTFKDGNFTRVRLNEHFIVVEIVCITMTKMSFDFLQSFCGKHESLLNNMLTRWYIRETDDFLSFFQEPWAELLMHEAYEDLHQITMSLVMETATDILNLYVERGKRKELLKRYMHDMGTTKDVENNFISFLRKYRKDFKHAIALPEDFVTKN